MVVVDDMINWKHVDFFLLGRQFTKRPASGSETSESKEEQKLRKVIIATGGRGRKRNDWQQSDTKVNGEDLEAINEPTREGEGTDVTHDLRIDRDHCRWY